MTDYERIRYAANEIDGASGRAQLARSAAKGQLQRIVRGAYVSTEEWTALNRRNQYLLRIMAVARTRRSRPVISHHSAAAIWGLPILGDWPTAVHVTVPPTVGRHSRPGLAKHSARLTDEDVVQVDGVMVTSIARTVLDMAAIAPFMTAVVMADRALLVDRFGKRPPLATFDQLERAWIRAQPIRSHQRTCAVLSFAETRSETPIESVSRVNMRVVGVPKPRLQVAHYDAVGFIGEPDFTWEEYTAVGEADGDQKYLEPEFRGGRTPERVFLDEKHREDRLRALPRSVARWPWKVALSPTLLAAKLTAIGLPTGRTWSRTGK
jgi:hypothetical protein